MESFEQLCRVALEAEGFAVTGNIKFPVRRKTKRVAYEEYQTHGYEIDLGREPINLPVGRLARVRYAPIATKFRSTAK